MGGYLLDKAQQAKAVISAYETALLSLDLFLLSNEISVNICGQGR